MSVSKIHLRYSRSRTCNLCRSWAFETYIRNYSFSPCCGCGHCFNSFFHFLNVVAVAPRTEKFRHFTGLSHWYHKTQNWTHPLLSTQHVTFLHSNCEFVLSLVVFGHIHCTELAMNWLLIIIIFSTVETATVAPVQKPTGKLK